MEPNIVANVTVVFYTTSGAVALVIATKIFFPMGIRAVKSLTDKVMKDREDIGDARVQIDYDPPENDRRSN